MWEGVRMREACDNSSGNTVNEDRSGNGLDNGEASHNYRSVAKREGILIQAE